MQSTFARTFTTVNIYYTGHLRARLRYWALLLTFATLDICYGILYSGQLLQWTFATVDTYDCGHLLLQTLTTVDICYCRHLLLWTFATVGSYYSGKLLRNGQLQSLHNEQMLHNGQLLQRIVASQRTVTILDSCLTLTVATVNSCFTTDS